MIYYLRETAEIIKKKHITVRQVGAHGFHEGAVH